MVSLKPCNCFPVWICLVSPEIKFWILSLCNTRNEYNLHVLFICFRQIFLHSRKKKKESRPVEKWVSVPSASKTVATLWVLFPQDLVCHPALPHHHPACGYLFPTALANSKGPGTLHTSWKNRWVTRLPAELRYSTDPDPQGISWGPPLIHSPGSFPRDQAVPRHPR